VIVKEQLARAPVISPEAPAVLSRGTGFALWALLGFYALARVLTVFPGGTPLLVIIALQVLLPLTFALIHGSNRYGIKGALVFLGLFLLVGNIFENLGVLTGFPFGHYTFTDAMGPKIFQVPILLGVAYVGMGYLSWTLALLITDERRSSLSGSNVFIVPVVASFIMVAWDLSTEPVWSTMARCWTWRDGGAYFGAPVSNFLGWYLTVFVFYQLFAIYVRRRSNPSITLPSGYWRPAVLFYAVCAAGNVLLAVRSHGAVLVADATGRQWKIDEITAASALVSIFTMGAFAVIAWTKNKSYR